MPSGAVHNSYPSEEFAISGSMLLTTSGNRCSRTSDRNNTAVAPNSTTNPTATMLRPSHAIRSLCRGRGVLVKKALVKQESRCK